MGALGREQFAAVSEHPLLAFAYRIDLLGAGFRSVARADVEGVLDAGQQGVAIGFGDAQQDADRLQGELPGEVVHDVEGAPSSPALPAGSRVRRAQLLLQFLHHPTGEPGADQPADPGVARVVHHVEHDSGDRQVGQQGAAVLRDGRPAPTNT